MIKRSRVIAVAASMIVGTAALAGLTSQEATTPGPSRDERVRAVETLGESIGCLELRAIGSVAVGSLDRECLEANGNWALIQHFPDEPTRQLFLKNVSTDRYRHLYVVGPDWALSRFSLTATQRAAVAAGGELLNW